MPAPSAHSSTLLAHCKLHIACTGFCTFFHIALTVNALQNLHGIIGTAHISPWHWNQHSTPLCYAKSLILQTQFIALLWDMGNTIQHATVWKWYKHNREEEMTKLCLPASCAVSRTLASTLAQARAHLRVACTRQATRALFFFTLFIQKTQPAVSYCALFCTRGFPQWAHSADAVFRFPICRLCGLCRLCRLCAPTNYGWVRYAAFADWVDMAM